MSIKRQGKAAQVRFMIDKGMLRGVGKTEFFDASSEYKNLIEQRNSQDVLQGLLNGDGIDKSIFARRKK